jgi:hypothetical protein
MGIAATPPRDTRPLTVDVPHETTDVPRLGAGTAFLAGGLACIMCLGCQRQPKAACRGGGALTRHAHDGRVRWGGVTLGRLQGTTGRAVCTVRPHVVWRDRQRPPAVARNARWATPGGLRLERCAGLGHLSPMALDRLIGACGHPRRVTVLTRGGLPRPVDVLADEPHRRCLPDTGSRPTMVHGRVMGPLGDTEAARAVALPQFDPAFPCAASPPEPSSRVRGRLTEGVASTPQRRRTLWPGARLGHCRRHALTTLPTPPTAIASPVRQAWRAPLPPVLYRGQPRKSRRVCALGQR